MSKMAAMDFVSRWKACSIVLTGAFGILGLVTEFKDKHTNKITYWGRVSLIGIVVTTLLGSAAQIKESSDDASKARDDSKKALQLAENTQATLQEVRRLVAPIGDPLLMLSFEVPCKDEAYSNFCLKVRGLRSEGLWKIWPIEPPRNVATVFVTIFKDGKKAEKYIDEVKSMREPDDSGDASFQLVYSVEQFGIENWFQPMGGAAGVTVATSDHPWKLVSFRSHGELVGTKDLDGAVLVIETRGHVLRSLKLSLTKADMFFPNGQEAEAVLPVQHIELGGNTDVDTIDSFSLKVR